MHWRQPRQQTLRLLAPEWPVSIRAGNASRMGNDLNEYPSEELNAMERQKIRRMLQENERAHWLWGFLIKLVIAGGAIATAIVSVKQWLSGFVQWK